MINIQSDMKNWLPPHSRLGKTKFDIGNVKRDDFFTEEDD